MPDTAVYSCRDMPTMGQFMDSDAFIRGIMGPFGCLSADSEFLTRRGWKRMDAYTEGDEVLTWSADGSAHFELPAHYVDFPCERLISFDSGSLKMALSEEHRVPHWNYVGKWQVRTAAEIALSTTRKTIPTVFSLGHTRMAEMSDDMIRFAVMMHADGHYVPRGKQAVVCVRKERKKTRARQILAALDIEFEERLYESRPTETSFVFYPPYVGKHFDHEWWGCSQDQLAVVLDEFQYWDGLHNHAESVFTTAHKVDADFIQYAAHANGRRAAIHIQVHPNENWKPTYFVRVRVSDNAKNRASVREHTKIEMIDAPGGRKYCFTVSTGFFVARYKDTIFITGNSGKSSGCVIEVGQRGVAQAPGPDGVRRSRWALVRNSYRQLEDTTMRTFAQWFPPERYGEWIPSKHQFTIKALKAEGDDRGAEIEVLFRALDRPDQVGNLLSLELTGAWLNEAREIPWPIVQAVEGRVGRFPRMQDGGPTWFGVMMDTNPPDVDSEWFKFFEETDHSERIEALAEVIPGMTVAKYRQLFKQPSGLAPNAENLKHLPAGYYQRLAAGKSDEWVKIYVHGQYGFVMDGMPVWPEYSDSIHCPADLRAAPKPVHGQPIVRSYDFGLTPACIYSQITPRGQWIVFDEQVATSMGADQFSDEVLEHSARNYSGFDFLDYGDPAGAERAQTDQRTCFEIMRSKNIAIEPGLQSPRIRLESVRKPLRTLVDGRPQFVLHSRCKQLRRGLMGGYHYRRLRISGERYTDKPEKNLYSHPCDALGYAATRLFGHGITSSRTGAEEEDRRSEQGRSSTTGY